MPQPFSFSPVLQVDFLNDLYTGDWTYAETVFENVIVEMPKLMGEAGNHLQKGNTEAFRQTLHKAKPLFGYVGLPQTQALIQALENSCKAGQVNGALHQGFEDLKKKIEQDSLILKEEHRRLAEYNQNTHEN